MRSFNKLSALRAQDAFLRLSLRHADTRLAQRCACPGHILSLRPPSCASECAPDELKSAAASRREIRAIKIQSAEPMILIGVLHLLLNRCRGAFLGKGLPGRHVGFFPFFGRMQECRVVFLGVLPYMRGQVIGAVQRPHT